jgi:hypothetical protein
MDCVQFRKTILLLFYHGLWTVKFASGFLFILFYFWNRDLLQVPL